jgi:hypothetical protein
MFSKFYIIIFILKIMDLYLGDTNNIKIGKGVFANKNFKKNEKILEFKGRLIKREEIPNLQKPDDDRYVQIEKKGYLGPSNDLDDFINHSCNPNTGLKIKNGKAILVSIRKIKKGEEITYDYSTTMDEDNWEIDCLCEAKNCRKRIRDFKYLPKSIQKKYIRLGIVPEYILKDYF